jgi:hypothetical protein
MRATRVSEPSGRLVSCSGGLVMHVDQTVAGCIEDSEPDGCRGLERRHEGGDPHRCFEWYPNGCDYCGIH